MKSLAPAGGAGFRRAPRSHGRALGQSHSSSHIPSLQQAGCCWRRWGLSTNIINWEKLRQLSSLQQYYGKGYRYV